MLPENRKIIKRWDGRNKELLIKLLRLNTPGYFASAEEKDFDTYLDREVDAYYVVEENEEIIGCGGINYGFDEGKSARLSWDIIHPKKHGQGYGSALVKYRLNEIAKHSNVERVIVRTTVEAEKFYEKFGFVLKHAEKDFWADGFDLRELHLEIRS